MVLGGDLMLNGISPSRKPLDSIAGVTKPATIALANLEIPLTDRRTATTRKTPAELRARSQYILKASPGHAPSLADIGLDAVSLANNHSMDFGKPGLDQMLKVLDAAAVPYAGAGDNQAEASQAVTVKTTPGGEVGMVSALAFMNTGSLWKCWPATKDSAGLYALAFNAKVDSKAKSTLKRWIGLAKRKHQIVVVSYHWGLEKQTIPTSYQVNLARATIDSGADVVWGHHPHVLQGAEIYRGKPILYSMGNLVSPRPASTGLVRLFFEGSRYRKLRFLPATISGGRVSMAAPGEARFSQLSAAIQRRYPHASSRSPYQSKR
jgi:poly-gamma-glutamate synthesis protein (capsule biosynthesis protein)